MVQLFAGLALYGFSMALMIEATLGLNPWDVFHQGVAERTGWTFGTVTIVVGVLVLLLWMPLRQRPGIGTVSNVIVIGIAVDASLYADARLCAHAGGASWAWSSTGSPVARTSVRSWGQVHGMG